MRIMFNDIEGIFLIALLVFLQAGGVCVLAWLFA
jgi:hypothetical protein